MKRHLNKKIIKQRRALITFGMPVYKNECLEDAIKSILNQTYKNIELVIINDASPEDIRATVAKFNDPRIRYYENTLNIGKYAPVKNWNKVLEYAKGKYFVLASDDDICLPTFASQLIKCIEKLSTCNVVHCRLKTVNRKGEYDYSPSCPQWESGVDFVWHAFNGSRLLSISEFLCRTKALRGIKGFIDFPLAWSSDYATWFTLAQKGGVGYVKDILVEKKNLGENLTSKYPLELAVKSCHEYSEWFNDFQKNMRCIDELEEQLNVDLLQRKEKYFDKMKISSIVNHESKRCNIWSPFSIILFCLRKRKIYNLSLRILAISELYVVQRLVKNIHKYFKR
jgi:glycosyltransferase involved in cell wall biosynthesis